MKITKIVNWTTGDGKQAEVTIDVTREMKMETAYSDGWNVDLGNKTNESLNIVVTLGGKRIGYTFEAPTVVDEKHYFGKDYVAKVKAVGGYARLLDNVVIKEEQYNMIMAAIKDATTEASQDKEYTDLKASEIAAEAIEEANTEASIKRYAEQIKNGLCPKCGTYCYGDCTAN